MFCPCRCRYCRICRYLSCSRVLLLLELVAQPICLCCSCRSCNNSKQPLQQPLQLQRRSTPPVCYHCNTYCRAQQSLRLVLQVMQGHLHLHLQVALVRARARGRQQAAVQALLQLPLLHLRLHLLLQWGECRCGEPRMQVVHRKLLLLLFLQHLHLRQRPQRRNLEACVQPCEGGGGGSGSSGAAPRLLFAVVRFCWLCVGFCCVTGWCVFCAGSASAQRKVCCRRATAGQTWRREGAVPSRLSCARSSSMCAYSFVLM